VSARLIGWGLVVIGAIAVAITFIVSSDVTVRMTAGMAYGIGLVILAIAMAIIVTSRKAPRA
jgi:hypothetical protein